MLCSDLSALRDLKVVYRVPERDLEYFRSLWRRSVVATEQIAMECRVEPSTL